MKYTILNLHFVFDGSTFLMLLAGVCICYTLFYFEQNTIHKLDMFNCQLTQYAILTIPLFERKCCFWT